METIRLEAAKEGMRIGKDVSDRSGRLLVAAGTLLEQRHLRILKSWGVADITITRQGGAEDENLVPDVAPEQLAEADQLLSERLRFNDGNIRVVSEAKRILTLRLAKALVNG